MKRNIVLCLSLALCLLAAGCGGQSAPTADAVEPVSYTHLTLPTN